MCTKMQVLENSGESKLQSHGSFNYHTLCLQLYVAETTGLLYPEA